MRATGVSPVGERRVVETQITYDQLMPEQLNTIPCWVRQCYGRWACVRANRAQRPLRFAPVTWEDTREAGVWAA